MKVLGGVPILGRVATPYMSALKTETKMDPCVPDLYALLAHVFVGVGDFDLIEMIALWHDDFSLNGTPQLIGHGTRRHSCLGSFMKVYWMKDAAQRAQNGPAFF
jgi:hypothetical protein